MSETKQSKNNNRPFNACFKSVIKIFRSLRVIGIKSKYRGKRKRKILCPARPFRQKILSRKRFFKNHPKNYL